MKFRTQTRPNGSHGIRETVYGLDIILAALTFLGACAGLYVSIHSDLAKLQQQQLDLDDTISAAIAAHADDWVGRREWDAYREDQQRRIEDLLATSQGNARKLDWLDSHARHTLGVIEKYESFQQKEPVK